MVAMAGILIPSPERREQMFPRLSPAQIDRIAAHGKRHRVSQGQMLFKQGDADMPFFVLVAGYLEIVQPTVKGEIVIVTHEPGSFTGELNTLSGRHSLVCGRMKDDGEVIELDRNKLQQLVQTDAELSEIFMRA